MQVIDHTLVVVLLVVQPLYGYLESRRLEAEAQAGQVFDRRRFYRLTAVMEWAFLAVLAAVWLSYGRSVSDLGLLVPGGIGFWIGLGLLVTFTAGLAYAVVAARRASDAEKVKQARSLASLAKYLPHTRPELNTFFGLSVTAGIVEEIVYRGFLFWYLTQFMPLYLAVLASAVIFGFAHSYQGANGAFRCGLVGLGFGAFYALTGSIWLPIVAHAFMDVLQGAAIYEILRKDEVGLKPQTV